MYVSMWTATRELQHVYWLVYCSMCSATYVLQQRNLAVRYNLACTHNSSAQGRHVSALQSTSELSISVYINMYVSMSVCQYVSISSQAYVNHSPLRNGFESKFYFPVVLSNFKNGLQACQCETPDSVLEAPVPSWEAGCSSSTAQAAAARGGGLLNLQIDFRQDPREVP